MSYFVSLPRRGFTRLWQKQSQIKLFSSDVRTFHSDFRILSGLRSNVTKLQDTTLIDPPFRKFSNTATNYAQEKPNVEVAASHGLVCTSVDRTFLVLLFFNAVEHEKANLLKTVK